MSYDQTLAECCTESPDDSDIRTSSSSLKFLPAGTVMRTSQRCRGGCIRTSSVKLRLRHP